MSSSGSKGKGIIGRMRHEIVVQQVSRAADGQGGFTETWSTFATVWAAIDPVSAYQQFQAEALQHRVTHKITMRYLSGLTSDMRISFGGRLFHIQSFRDFEEKGKFHEVQAEEGAPA